MDTKRDAKWDNVKLILITLVVVGHVAEYYISKSNIMYVARFYIYIFHMPAFLFVSGLFSKKVIQEKRWNYITKFLLFYFVLKGIKYIYATIAGENKSFKIFHESGSPWFVLALFFMFIITFYVKDLKPVWVISCSILLCLFAGYTTEDTQFLVFLRTINFYPFFYLGFILDKDKILKFTENALSKMLAWIILIATLIFCYFYKENLHPYRVLLAGQHSYWKMDKYQEQGWIIRFSLMLLTTAMIFCIITIAPKKRNILTKYGERTLAIYMTHQFFLHIIFSLSNCGKILEGNHSTVGAFILLGFGVILTFLCGNKYFYNFFNWLGDPSNKYKKK